MAATHQFVTEIPFLEMMDMLLKVALPAGVTPPPGLMTALTVTVSG
jgi:hypothetical protein